MLLATTWRSRTLARYTSQAFLHNWHRPERGLQARFAGINPKGIVPSVDSPMLAASSLRGALAPGEATHQAATNNSRLNQLNQLNQLKIRATWRNSRGLPEGQGFTGERWPDGTFSQSAWHGTGPKHRGDRYG